MSLSENIVLLARLRRSLPGEEQAPDDLLKAGFVDIFIEPPSMEVLRERLRRRGEDSDEVVERRLRNAATEMARRHECKYRVINEDVDTAYADMRANVMREMGLLPIGSP